MNICIITGASSGIGEEFAYELDITFSNIDEIWLLARDKNRLENVASKLKTKTRIFSIDLSLKEDLDSFSKTLNEISPCIKMLVNAAGVGTYNTFIESNLSELTNAVNVNILGTTSMIKRCVPFMHKGSRIINLSSGAAFLPEPKFSVYAASKSYVLSLSRALNKEFRKNGITITCVLPGPVDTPFIEKAYKGKRISFIKKLSMISASKVVLKAIKDSKDKKELSIPSFSMRLLHVGAKLLPTNLFMKFM